VEKRRRWWFQFMSRSLEQRLSGRVALVTGCGSGIGRATCVRFASEGAAVVGNDVDEKTALETRQMIEKLGKKAIVIKADISKSNEVEEIAKEAYEKFGRVDILVNNAGVSGTPYKLIDLPEKEWDEVMGVNLRGTWLVSKVICKRMLKQEPAKGSALLGKVINISSIAGKTGQQTIGCYSATKAGIIALTQAMARELGPKITVNAICPGFILTNIYRNSEDLLKAAAKLFSNIHTVGEIPMKRIGQPEDVANVAAFLASTDSDYMTGQAINICGGLEYH
jgi:NAD(P)-dependent dehydrogenase (short-subunit alcohol dehydrogenase family)